MEEIGRVLLLEPYMSSIVLCGDLIADLGSDAQRSGYLPRIISGDCRGAFAHHEVAATTPRAWAQAERASRQVL